MSVSLKLEKSKNPFHSCSQQDCASATGSLAARSTRQNQDDHQRARRINLVAKETGLQPSLPHTWHSVAQIVLLFERSPRLSLNSAVTMETSCSREEAVTAAKKFDTV